ncbi:hypothetical protein [Shewanella sp. GXUN23E]|uniref:hypothetical protein n=1 Tax=Shewanella sp. GXUN23E TaxID=3422498 RepID=UPI003D7E7DFB
MYLRGIVLGCLLVSACSFGAQIVTDESLVSIDMLPVCNGDAQVKLVYTNVSEGKLLVDPSLIESAMFDPFSAGVDLYTSDFEEVPLKIMGATNSHGKLERYAVFGPGESVEHLIDFDEILTGSIDKTRNAIVSFGFTSQAIKENGDIVIIDVSSPFLLKDHVIAPSCWQE